MMPWNAAPAIPRARPIGQNQKPAMSITTQLLSTTLTSQPGGTRGQLALRVLTAGLVVGLISVANAIAYAGLIYGGKLSGGLAAGISMILCGFAVTSIVIAWFSSHAGTVASPFATTAVVYPLIASAVIAVLPPSPDAELQAMTVAMVCGLITVLSGLAFLAIGMAKLGSLARLLPYPVINGYNAGSGWLFVAGALGLAAGANPRGSMDEIWFILPKIGACIALGLLIVVLTRWRRHWAVMPALLVTAGLGYHAIRHGSGISRDDAEAAGWLLGPFPPGRIWAAPSLEAASRIPWAALAHLITGPALTIILLGGTSAIIFLTGIELELHRRLNLDREMTVVGLGNILGGLAGGLSAGHSVVGTSLVFRMHAHHRAIGIVVAACCAATLVIGSAALTSVPRFVLGGLLLANGVDRLLDRIVLDRVKLPLHEWILVILVLLGVIGLGYVQGVALGLALTLVIFAWNYKRISVIRGITTGAAHRSSVVRSPEAQAIIAAQGAGVRICRLQGYLFFLNAHDVLQAVLRMTQQPVPPRVLILDFQHAVGMDTSACLVFRRLHQLAEESGFSIMMTQLPPPVQAQFARQHVPTAHPARLIGHDTIDKALRATEDMFLAEAGSATEGERADLADVLSRSLAQPIAPARLEPYLARQQFAAGAVLIQQGAAADGMYFIEGGQVMAQLERAGQRPVHLRSSTAGTIVGEVAIYAGGARTATVLAETDCDAVFLSTAAIARMEQQDPVLAGLLHRSLAAMLSEKLADSNRILDRSLD